MKFWIVGALSLILFPHVLFAVTFRVDRTDDPVPPANVSSLCQDNVPNDCSLRQSVLLANTLQNTTVEIILDALNYNLTITGASELEGKTGDLDLRNNNTVVIKGAGANRTIIGAGSLSQTNILGQTTRIPFDDRLFDVPFAGVNLTFDGVTLTSGNPGADDGGNIHFVTGNNGQLQILQSHITNGSSSRGGGISVISGMQEPSAGKVIIKNSTISGNTGTRGAGGIRSDGVPIILENSTITGNNAGTGEGGAFFLVETVERSEIRSSTITNNRASTRGGGIDLGVLFGKNSPAIIENSILFGNENGDCISNLASGGQFLTSSGHNILGDVEACQPTLSEGDLTEVADLGLDGQLSVANGGTTPTLALLPNSIAIDAGNTSACPGTDGKDQRGVVRPQGSACDIGAFEVAVAAGTPPTSPVGTDPTTGTPPTTSPSPAGESAGGCNLFPPRPPM